MKGDLEFFQSLGLPAKRLTDDGERVIIGEMAMLILGDVPWAMFAACWRDQARYLREVEAETLWARERERRAA